MSRNIRNNATIHVTYDFEQHPYCATYSSSDTRVGNCLFSLICILFDYRGLEYSAKLPYLCVCVCVWVSACVYVRVCVCVF